MQHNKLKYITIRHNQPYSPMNNQLKHIQPYLTMVNHHQPQAQIVKHFLMVMQSIVMRHNHWWMSNCDVVNPQRWVTFFSMPVGQNAKINNLIEISKCVPKHRLTELLTKPPIGILYNPRLTSGILGGFPTKNSNVSSILIELNSSIELLCIYGSVVIQQLQ